MLVMDRQELKTYIDQFKVLTPLDHKKFGVKDPREQYGVTDADLDYFKNGDKELKAAIDKYFGMDFPVHTIDDFLIVELAGMVEVLGPDGAIEEFKRIAPRRLRALYRCVARNHKRRQES